MPKPTRPENFRPRREFRDDLSMGVHDRVFPTETAQINSRIGQVSQRIAQLRNLIRGNGPGYHHSYEVAELQDLQRFKQALIRQKRHKEN